MKIIKKGCSKFEKETINLEGKKITCIMEIKKMVAANLRRKP